MKTFRRFFYRLVCWINYPTPRERMWHMYDCGKQAGKREALKELPIVQVQPRQHARSVEVHLPPGEWSRQWRKARKPPTTINEMSPEQIAEVPTIHDLMEDAWLNSGNDPTLTMPAVVKALHQGRHAG